MNQVQDLSFEFEKSDYGLNDSDFFKFDDSDIMDNDELDMELEEGSDFLDDDADTRDMLSELNSTINFSFFEVEDRFRDQFLNKILENGVRKGITAMEKKTEKTYEEISKFENIINGFPAWAFNKTKRVYRIQYVDHNFNIFLFEETPVYVYIEYTHREEREKVLENVREYLFEATKNECYIKSDLITKHDFLKKLSFTFIAGKKNYIIQAKMKFNYMITQFITFCAQIDPRVYELGNFLTAWAVQRNLLYDIVPPNVLYLIMIFFLMKTNPPIIPELFDKNGAHEKKISVNIKGLKKIGGGNLIRKVTGDLHYEQDIIKVRQMLIDRPNKQKLGELIFLFFEECCENIVKNKHRVCLRTGELIEYPSNHKQVGFTVRHPFIDMIDLAPNLSRNLKGQLDIFKEELKLAYKNLKNETPGKLCAKKEKKETE